MKKIIIANWKMQVKGKLIASLAPELTDTLTAIKNNQEIVICPSYPYLAYTLELLAPHKNVYLGAQNCSKHENGAFTGEVSADMLQEVGVKYVILGHSERRSHFRESSEQIKYKALTAQKHGLHVILCIGELLEEYRKGNSIKFIEKQLTESVPNIIDPEKLTIAYEPVWAIGTGLTPTVNEISQITEYLKNCTYNKFRIIYGGSVSSNLAAQLSQVGFLDGLLVGGASTRAKEFADIIKNYFG